MEAVLPSPDNSPTVYSKISMHCSLNFSGRELQAEKLGDNTARRNLYSLSLSKHVKDKL
jgi:hypothetical protein